MKRITALCLAALLSLSGCGAREIKKTIFAMDTVIELTAFGAGAQEAIDEAEKELFRLDRLLNRGSEGSELHALNASGGGEVSLEAAEVIGRALEISKLTGGAFDPTVAPVMDLWGFYDQEFRVPSDDEIAAALPLVGWDRVSFNGNSLDLGGTRLDLGGIAKGWASGRAAEIMRKKGVASALLYLGGNVQVIGSRNDGEPWKIGIQNPKGEGYVGILSLTDCCAVTSGDYQRRFESGGKTYHHIINPETGYPAESGLSSVTVVCEDPALADGLSTALFVMGVERAADYWREEGGFGAVFIASNGEISVTSDIAGSFESGSGFEVIDRLE